MTKQEAQHEIDRLMALKAKHEAIIDAIKKKLRELVGAN